MLFNNVVFDVNVLLTFLVQGDTSEPAVKLVDSVLEGEVTGWIAAQSLPILEYSLITALSPKGVSSEEARQVAQDKNKWLCEHFKFLSLPGEETRLLIDTAQNLQEAQIAIAALALGDDVCIVSENPDFDALGKVTVMSPLELLQSQGVTQDKPISVLDLAPQQRAILPALERSIRQVLLSGQYIMGAEVKQFEQEVAEYLNVKHAIGVNSGTDALVIGLRALGIGEGDEVITTPFSFFATAESISNVGAKPVFVDIDAKNYNINPNLIREKITARTKAIMPVHLYGCPASMGQIMEIAQEYGLKVIEDCAQSFGARYYGTCSACENNCQESTRLALSGKATGTIGDVGAFSFFPSKNLGAYGDGGMVVTNDDQVAEMARMLRVHGAKKKYHNEIVGYNSRLDTLQAAILRVKLQFIDEWNEGRRRVAKTYNQLLGDLSGIMTPELADGHVFHQYTIRVLGGKRDQVKDYLAQEKISTMLYYPVPQDRLPVYQGLYPVNPVSDQLSHEVLSLPIWPEMEEGMITRIVEALNKVLR